MEIVMIMKITRTKFYTISPKYFQGNSSEDNCACKMISSVM